MNDQDEVSNKQLEMLVEEYGEDQVLDIFNNIEKTGILGEATFGALNKLTEIKNAIIKIVILSGALTALFLILDSLGLCPEIINNFIHDNIISNIDEVYGLGIALLCFLIIYIILFILLILVVNVLSLGNVYAEKRRFAKVKKRAGYPEFFLTPVFRAIKYWVILLPFVLVSTIISLPLVPIIQIVRKHKAKKALKKEKKEKKEKEDRKRQIEEIFAAKKYRIQMQSSGKKTKRPLDTKIH